MAKSEPKSFIFIAGGIGITPIRSMILHCLRHGRQNFQLYYFTRTPQAMAFREEFAAGEFADKILLHYDNGDPDQAYDLWPVLEQQRGAHLYCCGPRGLMDAVRDMTGHWPDSTVHFEDFVGASAPHPDDKPFEVKLAKSGKSYEVAPGVSILDTPARPYAGKLLRKRHLWHLPHPLHRRRGGPSRSRAVGAGEEERDHDLRVAREVDADAGYLRMKLEALTIRHARPY